MLVGGARAALGVGRGYEPQPIGTRASFDGDVRGYFLDVRAKTAAAPAPVVTGRGLVYGVSGTALAQYALGWWERHMAGDDDARSRFLAGVDALVDAADDIDGELLWRYDVAVPKYRRQPPWYSAMAQGQATSALVRAHLLTGAERYADGARRAVAPLLREGELVIQAPEGPVLEECPSSPPSMILNGWIYALWGLWDASCGLNDAAARRRFADSAAALRALLPRFDTGWWTRYSLYEHDDLATPFYHRIHVAQAGVMHRLTGWNDLADAARRWRSYDVPRRRIRAVGAKSAATLRSRRGHG
ncbi:MAG TPA: D-glucuronyl C5-epimerase family protein [Gaiellaceae bacterium]|nr:D-glucuronyl C5-epimerase family protein [Gaiellaceae bacterium]